MRRTVLYLICSIFIVTSCEKEDFTEKRDFDIENTKESNIETFSKILSKAIIENSELRNFIKEEALDMFDNDYDVFYPTVKNKTITGSETFRDILKKYVDNEEALVSLENSLPLLTIYVPELPSGFNAETWNASEEIPLVTTGLVRDNSISYYNNGEIDFTEEALLIPGFPLLIIKNNERVKTSNGITKSSCLLDNNYEFIDEAFNGNINKEIKTKAGVISKSKMPYLVRAYEEMGVNGYYWQRDNIYYGLTKNSGTTGQGALDRSMIETITAINIEPEAYAKISDQDGDPYINTGNIYGPSLGGNDVFPIFWTEGKYEFKIDILINNTVGLGTTLTKYISASPSDLFILDYEKTNVSSNRYMYKFKSIQSTHTLLVDIPLVSWDLSQNGFSWKFLITETDDQEQVTRSDTNSSVFAANVSAGFKFGLNFGASYTTSKSSTYTIVTFKNSDDLGSLEANFSDPVIQYYTPFGDSEGIGTTYEIKNRYIRLSIEPRKRY
nr:hypothetical protein [Parabacteroides goldsteinii]